MSRNDNSVVRAGLMGVVMGIVAGAALAFFSEPKNRKKVKSGLDQLDSDSREKLSELKSSVVGANAKTKKALAKSLKSFVNQLESAR